MNFTFTLSPTNRPSLDQKLDGLDPRFLWDIKVTQRKSKRSNAQNSWARKYASEFGKHFGYDADFAYDLLMYKCNPVFKADPETGAEIRLGGHLSKKEDGTPRNTAEAAEVQEAMLRFGDSLGFYFDERNM